ncbi:MAG: ATP-dependent Clp protease proteolytic subunit [Lachnospiraceae bacterium]|nr:ATP-dependent Clp protease proteolytic subunit [Lachnospiraceae bacterium]
MSNNYLIPQIERESAAGVQQVSLVTDAFSNRRLFLFGEINEALVYSFTMQMLYLMEDTQSEINIYIDSPGGEVNSGLAIYDLIQYCKAPINMYCVGLAASMGAIVFAGGQKGRRFMLPHSKVMIHEPMIAGGLEGSASTIRSTAIKILQMRQLLNSILAKHSGKTTQEIDRATEHDNFMSAEEAIAFGLCDAVADRI